MPEADNKTPAFAALGLVVIGIVIAVVQGFTHGSIGGGIIALLGAIPACFGMWKGIQQETQGTLGLSVVALIASLLVGGLLIVLRVIHWVS
jgi:hypothetical protein